MSVQTTINDFTVLNKLGNPKYHYIFIGSGAFSDVFKVKRKSDNLEYALKKVKLGKLNEKEKENALNEVRILASIDHPNIVSYKEAFFEESTQTLCIVMEYADGGDLQSKINELKKDGKFMKEEDIWNIFYQMVVGLQALHKTKIVHRDIKCANIFLTKDGMAKLGDLNVSKIAKMGILKTQTGTPYYASPEVWQDKPYDKKSDIWSLGCVLYELTTLNPPFTAKDMQGLYNRVLKGVYPKIQSHFSNDLAAMIKCLLQVDPAKRLATKQIMHMPVFIAKYNEIREEKVKESDTNEQGVDDDYQNLLLGTIKVPKNLRLLSERLPKSNYGKKEKGDKSVLSEIASSAEQTKENKNLIPSDLPSIQEESEKKDKLVRESSQGSQIQQQYIPPRHNKNIKSERITNSKASNQIVQNQLAEKAQQIQIQNQQIQQTENQQANNRRASQPLTQQDDNQRIAQQKSSLDRQDSSNQDNMIRVKQYRKKLYLNQIPKTSPAQRNGIEDMYYQIAHGKNALIEKREQMQQQKQQQQLVQHMQQQQQEVEKPIVTAIQQQELISQRNQYGSRASNQQQQNLASQIDNNIRRKPPRNDSATKRNIAQYNSNDRSNPRINLPSLPQIYSSRQVLSSQNTPKYQMYSRADRQIPVHQNQLITPQERMIGGESKLGMPPMMPRTKSKDSMQIYNNLREIYKNGLGVQNVVSNGRLESQRLLLENYRKVDAANYGYNAPINLKKQNQQYIPMSQHGQRNIVNNAQYQLPHSRQNINVPSQQNGIRPQWWG